MIKIVKRSELVKGKRQPAIGKCACGREVELFGFTNSCDCGRDYNSAGQELAPRRQWGEETCEIAADILNAEAAGFAGEDW
jgi:hypothetical protein